VTVSPQRATGIDDNHQGGLSVHDYAPSTAPTCPEGRLLALRCLGLPQVITRAPMSRRRALRYRLGAFWARIRPGNAAELASVVLRLGDEIDRHERMLDVALRDAPAAVSRTPCRTAAASRS
jgi:hypothetical protein